MKTRFCKVLLPLFVVPCLVYAQTGWVGINTPNPAATLDVNGTMKIRQSPQAASLPGFQLMAINNNPAGDSQVSKVDPQLIADFTIAQMGIGTNSTVYSAKKTTGISLINLGLFPTGFRAVNFLVDERIVGSASLFSDADNTYTVPSNGVYVVGYNFRYGTGLQAEVLSNSPGIGILRTRSGVTTLIDNRIFSGANLLVLSLTISETNINSVYNLQAGDKLTFGLTGSTALSATLISSSSSSFYIYKISN